MSEVSGRKIVAFELGNEEFGISMDQVISIERSKEITGVPQSPEYISGIFELRGEVIPVVDLRRYLSITTNDNIETEHIIIVSIRQKRFGLVVDQATDIITIPADVVENVPVHGLKLGSSVEVAKLEERLIMIIDVEKLLMNSDISGALEEVTKVM